MDSTAARAPFVETSAEYIQVSKLRSLNKREVRALRSPLIVIIESKPLAVVVPIALYEQMQQMAIGAMGPILDKVEMLAQEIGFDSVLPAK